MNDNASIREHILGEETVFNGLLIKVNHIDVELPNGKTGYMLGDYLRKAK